MTSPGFLKIFSYTDIDDIQDKLKDVLQNKFLSGAMTFNLEALATKLAHSVTNVCVRLNNFLLLQYLSERFIEILAVSLLASSAVIATRCLIFIMLEVISGVERRILIEILSDIKF